MSTGACPVILEGILYMVQGAVLYVPFVWKEAM